MRGKTKKRTLVEQAVEAEIAFARLGYAYYRKAQVEKFKSVMNDEEITALRKESKKDFCRRDVSEFYFDGWLIEKGCVPVLGFEGWIGKQS